MPMEKDKSLIRVGPAGWHYKDWYGIVYPEKPDKQFKELDFLATLFDTAEINSTFYRPANAFMGDAWVRKVAHNPNFLFTAKLWQRFTHERKPFTSEEVKQYLQGVDPLARAQKLGAILCQFPWSFKNSEENRKWLATLLDTFKDYPLVVEVRHSSWDQDEFFSFLDKKDAGFATIDQPVIGQSIPFKPVRTGKIGYVRMHGRNYQSWFPKKNEKDKQSVFARYDYYYPENEVSDIVKKVEQVAEGSKETFVIQNNHPRGQAVANAMQIRAALGETILNLPETMLAQYPDLKKLVNPD